MLSTPAATQQPTSVNPDSQAVKEEQLLLQSNKIQGRGTLPDVRSYTIEQPAGAGEPLAQMGTFIHQRVQQAAPLSSDGA